MEFDIWTQSLLSAMNTLWSKLAGFIPNLLGALLIAGLGLLLANILNAVVSKLLAKLGVDRLLAGTGLTKILERGGIRLPISVVAGKIIYWFVLLVFLVSAAESLGLQRVSATLDLFALYLPKVFGAALLMLAGVLLAQLASTLARGAAESIGLSYAATLARLAQITVIVISLSVAVGQLDIKAELFNTVIAIVVGSVGLALALALGFGSREVAAQIIAGIYLRELYENGQHIECADATGLIAEIGTVKTIIEDEQGNLISISNTVLLSTAVKSR